MSVTADFLDLNLQLALACPSIRPEGGESSNTCEHWRERSARHQRVVLLGQGGCSLQTASLVIHELSFGIQRLANGCRKERFCSYLQNLRRLMGRSYLHDNAKSASFKFFRGPGPGFAFNPSDLAINQQEHLFK